MALFHVHLALVMLFTNMALGVAIITLFVFLVRSPKGSSFVRSILFIILGIVLAVTIRQILEFSSEALSDAGYATLSLWFTAFSRISDLVGASVIVFGAYKLFRSLSNPALREAITSSERKVLRNFFKHPTNHNSPWPSTRGKVLSSELNLTFDQLSGKRILLEFDPAAEYENYVRQYVSESLVNGHSIVVFTRQGSNISTLKNVKMVILSVKENPPVDLLPDGNLNISTNSEAALLEAFNHIFETYRKVSIVVDNISNITMNIGFEKTYNILQLVGERLGESSIMLLLNPKAHDEKVKALFEGYSNILVSSNREGIRLLKS
ncbi:MAG: hypothetical protein ACYC7D_13830 [Nitrososphaerales archaeon]